jgi:MFS family permease
MQDAGSGWLMTSLTTSPIMVALIQAATTLPIFLLALPGGALADIIDRRRLLVGSQILAIAGAGLLAAATWSGITSPVTLLCTAAIMGMAAALSGPAFQAIVPELVPPRALPEAISLNSLGVNISRAVGPAIGGLTIALLGPAAVFAANALLTASVAVVLLFWRRQAEPQHLPPEHILGALRLGLRYARRAPALRVVLVRTSAFFLFSSALMALVPLIGRRDLNLDPGQYGLLLGSMGLGAVAAALLLRRMGPRTSPDTLSVSASIVLGLAMFALAQAHSLSTAATCMACAGAAWITALSVLNGAAQRATPAWVRARSLALYLVVFQGSMSAGAVLWGTLATRFGVASSISIAALGLVLSIALIRAFPLPPASDLEPSLDWPSPVIAEGPSDERGPVMVTIEYRVDPSDLATFFLHMHGLEQIRRRDGAFDWILVEDVTTPGLMVETFLVASWLEHLRQHERRTHADVPLQDAVRQLHVGDAPPLVRHFIAPQTRQLVWHARID